MSTHPVLVVHGVGNRGDGDPATVDGEAAFDARVERLQTRVGKELRLIPVYWGHLAADPRHVDATLPHSPDVDVRADALEMPDSPGALSLLPGSGSQVRDSRSIDILTRAAVGGSPPTDLTRDSPGGGDDVVARAIESTWSSLTYLPTIEDPVILSAAGDALRSALEESATPPLGGGDPDYTMRDDADDVRAISDGVGRVARSVLRGIDRALGAAMGEVGGRLNYALRTSLGPGIVGFFGDIIAYLDQRQAAIRARLDEVIEAEAPGYGTSTNAIGAIGHSLGGVILFDAAVTSDPIHYSSLVTFGSQAPFFHAISARSSRLPAFDGTSRVRLPSTVGTWINVWEPLDVVAFAASRVFELSDGSLPEDRGIPYAVGSGLWTHSSYWERPELVTAISDAFAGAT